MQLSLAVNTSTRTTCSNWARFMRALPHRGGTRPAPCIALAPSIRRRKGSIAACRVRAIHPRRRFSGRAPREAAPTTAAMRTPAALRKDARHRRPRRAWPDCAGPSRPPWRVGAAAFPRSPGGRRPNGDLPSWGEKAAARAKPARPTDPAVPSIFRSTPKGSLYQPAQSTGVSPVSFRLVSRSRRHLTRLATRLYTHALSCCEIARP